jgi:hypothetical protein
MSEFWQGVQGDAGEKPPSPEMQKGRETSPGLSATTCALVGRRLPEN